MERLEFSARHVESGDSLEADDAERLANAAALSGRDWLSTHNMLDVAQAADVYELLQEDLDDRFERFSALAEMENLDRIDQMVSSLSDHLRNEQGRFNERIQTYRLSNDENKIRLIPAERGRLKRLEARFEERIAQLDLRRKLDKQNNFVSAGVIHVS